MGKGCKPFAIALPTVHTTALVATPGIREATFFGTKGGNEPFDNDDDLDDAENERDETSPVNEFCK